MSEVLGRLATAIADRYRLKRELGAGGMATVWLAEDLKHDREVAVKVLRPELSAVLGAERFLQEIKVTAHLQHPHILPLFDSGSAEGLLYYVMPYVEGESLRARLAREKQLPVDEAVTIAKGVASALDYAHRHGVIHRDIKPENILLHDGQPLVADFGIALAVSRAGGTRVTETGLSLGTPHYMSPEQATADRELTPRSDIYALAAVLYEMLIGDPPHTGSTAQAIIAKVVTERPRPIRPARPSVTPELEAAVLRGLEKIPADRVGSAAEFAESLGRPDVATPLPVSRPTLGGPAARAAGRRWALVGVSAVAGLVAGFALGRLTAAHEAASPGRLRQFVISTGSDHRYSTGSGAFPAVGVALSPDAETVVYSGISSRGYQLYRRRLGELGTTPIPGTDGGLNPFFTPDGRWLTFFVGASMKKIPPEGGVPVTVPTGAVAPQTTVWLDNERLVATGVDGSLQLIQPDGSARRVARPDSAAGEGSLNVFGVLPGGEVVLAVAAKGGSFNGRGVAVDLRSGEQTGVVDGNIAGLYYDAGYLLWVVPEGTLLAAPFDAARLRMTAPPVSLAQGVRVTVGGPPQVALSRNHSLVYFPEAPFQLTLVDRNGGPHAVADVRRRFHSPRMSPDGRRIAVDFNYQGTRDVWTLDVQQRTLTRLTFDKDGHDPVWSPDGKQVAFATARGGVIGIFLQSADGAGAAESLLVGGSAMTVGAFTPEGRYVVALVTGNAGSWDLAVVPVAGDRTPRLLLGTPFNEYYPAVSPDGRWLAYTSDESGQNEVYVRAFPDGRGKILVSQNGGSEPVWSRDGRELFYRGFDQLGTPLVAVSVQSAPDFRVLTRAPLFDVSEYEAAVPHANYDVTPDGKTFVMVYQGRLSEMVLVQNWTEEARRGAMSPAR
ncbi:MAG TPA: protein kinase [Gemmatimonadales bacterium]|nr:protein kinase [Gemmatimonadales bacterium]